MESPLIGHINSLIDEIVIYLMTFLDGKSIGRLGLCTKRFFRLNLNEDLWKFKLAIDYHMTSYDETSFRDSYKWCVKVTSISDHLWNELMDCPYDLPEEFKPYLLESIRIPGPMVLNDFEMAWTILMDCPYDLPQQIQPIIHKALLTAANKKTPSMIALAMAEEELEGATEELEEALQT